MNRITPPQKFSSLKESKYWSIDWARDTFPNSQFAFYILRKVGEGDYEVHGYAHTPDDAFRLRRELVEETGVKNYFVRAKQIRKTTIWAEAPGQTEDAFRDAMQSGDDSHIAPEQRDEFNRYAARTIAERTAYARVNRDAPRWSNR